MHWTVRLASLVGSKQTAFFSSPLPSPLFFSFYPPSPLPDFAPFSHRSPFFSGLHFPVTAVRGALVGMEFIQSCVTHYASILTYI